MADIGTKDLTALCGIKSIQGMIQFIKKHIARINVDGEHARKVGNEWLYDETAVERILEIRHKGTIPTSMVQETERIKELVAEQHKLLEKLTVAQAAIMSHKERIIDIQGKYLDQVRLLTKAKTEAEQELLEVQGDMAQARADKTIAEHKLEAMELAYKDKLEHLAKTNAMLEQRQQELLTAIEEMKQQGAMLISQVSQLKAEKQALSDELFKERNKSFLQRIFG